jgi:hypothetical protein
VSRNDPSEPPPMAIAPADEQSVYARLIEGLTHVATLLLLLTFGVYVFGVLEPHVALERLPQLWDQSLQRYLQLSDTHPGWRVIERLGRSDVMNLVGVGLLSSAPALSLLVLLPNQLRRRDWAQAGFCLGLVALMLLAAAGLPGRG